MRKKTLANKLKAVGHQIDNDEMQSAVDKINNDLLPKTDGEAPPPDWPSNSVVQQELEDRLLTLRALLEGRILCP